MHDPIDLDGLATTPLDPLAREAIFDAWLQTGNPASAHVAGERAADLVERGRYSVARLMGASPDEVVFTSGATEADNLAVTGTALAAIERGDGRRGIVVSSIEHKAVLEPARRLRHLGFEVAISRVTAEGYVDLAALQAAIGPGTLLVSVMAANNETGAIQPIADVVAMAHAAGALVHTDAAQAFGKIEVDVGEWETDYASLSSHKMHGPMGIGVLHVAAHAPRPAALIVGGGQERGLRSGTVPAPLVAGLGAAADRARDRVPHAGHAAEEALSTVLKELSDASINFKVNTGLGARLPGAVSLQLPQVDCDHLTQTLAKSIYLSTGSACATGEVRPSHVLCAMGLSPSEIGNTLRMYCAPTMTRHSARRAGLAIVAAIQKQIVTGRTVQ